MTLEWSGDGASEMPTGPYKVSTGKKDSWTPNGEHPVWWRSPNGPYKTLNTHPEAHWAVKFYNQVGIHTYPFVPDYPASSGCVRVSDEAAAQMIWTYTIVDVTIVNVYGIWPGHR